MESVARALLFSVFLPESEPGKNYLHFKYIYIYVKNCNKVAGRAPGRPPRRDGEGEEEKGEGEKQEGKRNGKGAAGPALGSPAGALPGSGPLVECQSSPFNSIFTFNFVFCSLFPSLPGGAEPPPLAAGGGRAAERCAGPRFRFLRISPLFSIFCGVGGLNKYK